MKRIIPAPVPPAQKYCFQCAQALPTDDFTADRRKADGRTYGCRKCLKAKHRERLMIQSLVAAFHERMVG